ncbi:MAG: FG-GAP-like repeat-containing protein [Bryobacteraceae bacterium]
MANQLDSFLKFTTLLAESAVVAADSVLTAAQARLDNLSGRKREADFRTPLSGPRNIDEAASDLANRTARLIRFTPADIRAIPAALQEWSRAARHSFGFLDWKDPKNLLLPLELPLSAGTLLTTATRRALASLQVVGPERFPVFVANAMEAYTEIQIWVSVQYGDLIARQEARLREAPDDASTRYQYGRALIKCGRYQEAADQLGKSAEDPAHQDLANYERSVALFRAGRYKEAVVAGTAAMDANPNNERARSWLWMSAQKLGGYPPQVPEQHRMELKSGRGATVLRYEDIASRIGLDKTSAGRGVAVCDFDNDGYQDVVISANNAGCTLYKNNRDGTFSDVSVGSGMDECVNCFAISHGDYNNDGYPDLFVTRLGFFGGEGELWRNNGNGTFTNVTKEAGLNVWGPAFAASWVDYNGDGFLDLFVSNNLGGVFDRTLRNRLFRNNGNGTFTEVTEEVGLKSEWPTIGNAWGDYDNDGHPDLFVSNAMGPSELYRNNGDGTFTEVSLEAGFGEYGFGSVCTWLDYDNDGWLDLVQFIWSDHDAAVHTLKTGKGPEWGTPTRVYRNNRDGTFTKMNEELNLNSCFGSMSGTVADVNNDGNVDIILGNGSPRMDRLEPMVLLQSDGKKFHDVTFTAGLPFAGKSHGTNAADLFGDGRISLIVAAGGAYPGELMATSVFCPKTLPGNYLNVRLRGTESNADAVGARIRIEAGGREQHRLVCGGTNFGCLPYEQHFGLADTEHVDSLEIRWPSGLRQAFKDIPANTTIRFIEGGETWTAVYPPKIDN